MDLRDFISFCEKEGELKRVGAEVDWDLELSHIAKLNEEKSGPALLFENVKGYKSPVITSVCTTTNRLSMIMGERKESTLFDLMRAWTEKGKKSIAPKWVSEAPCKQNIMKGDDIDLFKFPVPRWYPKDGGRYFGTAGFFITKDTDSSWVNLGLTGGSSWTRTTSARSS